VLLDDESTGQETEYEKVHHIDRITTLVRLLRDYKAQTWVANEGDDSDKPVSQKVFWPSLFEELLGFERNNKKGHSNLLMTHLLFNHPFYSDGKEKAEPFDYMDKYSRYCKVLIAAQTPDSGGDEETRLKWAEPLNDLPHNIDEINKGSLPDKILSQSAIIAGYATKKDMIPFELATVSNHASSAGWKKDPGWEYNREYIRSLMENNLVEVWENWSALALRDTLAFVSYSTKAPIMYQAESRYYSLYVFSYHLRYQLEKLSDEIVDYEMSNARRGRRIRDAFQRFRNHYWFQEVTRDFVGVEVFDRMKTGMKINELYTSVSNEVSEVTQHLQQKWEGSIKRWGTFLAILIWPSKTLWEKIIYPNIDWDLSRQYLVNHGWPIIAGLLVIVLVGLLVRRVIRTKKELWVPLWIKWSEIPLKPFRRLVLFLR